MQSDTRSRLLGLPLCDDTVLQEGEQHRSQDLPHNNSEPSDGDRYEIERISRLYGREVVAAVAFNAPDAPKRGRRRYWTTEEMATLVSIATAITENPDFSEGRNLVEALKDVAKMVRDPNAGLLSLLVHQQPALPKAADLIGSQLDDSIKRGLSQMKSPGIDDDAGGSKSE